MTGVVRQTLTVTEELIGDRRETHGDWQHTAQVSQDLKYALRVHVEMCEGNRGEPSKLLSAVQIEALEAILGKIGRIVAGDPDHKDHWRDIAGYALLGCGDAR